MTKQFSFTRLITTRDIDNFSQLSGDSHPLHTNSEFAQAHGFATIVAHGMLVGSLFSKLISDYLPSQNYMYISQSLVFHKPVYPNTQITVNGAILKELLDGALLVIQTQIYNEAHELLVSGEAKVKRIGKYA